MPKPEKLRILCFGDSLTSGYCSFGTASYPYHKRLTEELQTARPILDVEAVGDGLPGCTTRYYLQRFEEHFRPGASKYDWAIILGGTNDLGYRTNTPEVIYENLKSCWDLALSQGTKVLALTVPEVGVRSEADAKRTRLNDMIRQSHGGDIHVHDHSTAMPYWSMSADDRELYWDDGTHLTREGYDLMGQMIAARMLDILAQEDEEREQRASSKAAAVAETPRSPSSPSRRGGGKAFGGDNNVFDEEIGDSSDLAKGYVVVRRKDLN